MLEILLIIIIILLLINIFISLKPKTLNLNQLTYNIDKSFNNLEQLLRQESYTNREELRKNEQDNRQEIKVSIDSLASSISRHIINLSTIQQNQFDMNSTNIENTLESFNENMTKSLNDLIKVQNEKFIQLIDSTEKNLEEMRITVDEKLQENIDKKLSESFKMVNDRLEQVYKGLGEMQNLANGVGDLKKVLSNVKTRGVLGEVQLERILSQFLAKDQYEKNIITKKGSRDTVEFAIKLPGKDDLRKVIYLPLDAKFPLDIYNKLMDAYEDGNSKNIDLASKELEKFIKKSAKDIRNKYIDPPNTTEFGILFLPTEGLYAEVVKRQQLIEDLQRDFKINVTGPTTLVAFLNSLQMGFKSLAIEKHSSEVWRVLGEVKTEFLKFETVLNTAQNKLNQASLEIDKLVGTRTRQINRKLENIEKLGDLDSYKHITELKHEEN